MLTIRDCSIWLTMISMQWQSMRISTISGSIINSISSDRARLFSSICSMSSWVAVTNEEFSWTIWRMLVTESLLRNFIRLCLLEIMLMRNSITHINKTVFVMFTFGWRRLRSCSTNSSSWVLSSLCSCFESSLFTFNSHSKVIFGWRR